MQGKEYKKKMEELVKEQEENKRPPVDGKIRGVLEDAFSKYRKGEQKHGVLNIETDPRDFLLEAELELLDSIVYSAAEILKYRKLRRIRDEQTKHKAEHSGNERPNIIVKVVGMQPLDNDSIDRLIERISSRGIETNLKLP